MYLHRNHYIYQIYFTLFSFSFGAYISLTYMVPEIGSIFWSIRRETKSLSDIYLKF